MFLSKRGKYWYVFCLDELSGRRKTITTRTNLKGDDFKFPVDLHNFTS